MSDEVRVGLVQNRSMKRAMWSSRGAIKWVTNRLWPQTLAHQMSLLNVLDGNDLPMCGLRPLRAI